MTDSSKIVAIHPDTEPGWWIAAGRSLLDTTKYISTVQRDKRGIRFHNLVRGAVIDALKHDGYFVIEPKRVRTDERPERYEHTHVSADGSVSDVETDSCPVHNPEHRAYNEMVKAASLLITRYHQACAMGMNPPWTRALHDAAVVISEVEIRENQTKSDTAEQLAKDQRVLMRLLNRKVEA